MKILLHFALMALAFLLAFEAMAQISRSNNKKSVPYRTNYAFVTATHWASHTLEIRDGRLWGWGYNGFGGLGIGSGPAKVIVPIQIGTENKWVFAHTGNTWSMGIKSDGTLWAWGDNDVGQLGDSTTAVKYFPVQVGKDSTWLWVTSGFNVCYGIKSDGTLWAWGNNTFGLMGNGIASSTPQLVPKQVGTDKKWVKVDVDVRYTYGLKSDGTLWCWGNNLGYTPTQVGTDRNWVEISVGSDFIIALKADGTRWGQGKNDQGQLGDGTTIDRNTLTQLGTDNNWTQVSISPFSGFGIKANGTLWAWGDNDGSEIVGTNGSVAGLLGTGTLIDCYVPTQVGTDADWVFVSNGYNHRVAVKSDGSVWAWGDNEYGELGDSTTANRTSPKLIEKRVGKWVQASTSFYSFNGSEVLPHSMGLASDGSLWAWGVNNYGQLGSGNNLRQLAPVKIGWDNNWVSVSAGSFHSVALKVNGTLWAWGNNEYAQLGDGTKVDQQTPKQIGVANNWTSVSAGYSHNLGLKSDGTLWAWGNNDFGQIGDGTNTYKSRPQQVGTDNDWVSVATGKSHSLGLKANGTIWAWGNNADGTLGTGNTTQQNTPTQISGTDNNWVSLAAGTNSSYGLKSDGSIWGWGENTSSQLGDGTTMTRLIPSQIGTASDWVYITSSSKRVFALRSNGTLWACGSNYLGEIGIGNTILYSTLVQVGSANDWVSVTSGFNSTLALKIDRTRICGTGSNAEGQLGIGTTVSYTSFYCNGAAVGLNEIPVNTFPKQSGFSIYPNPNNGSFTITLNEVAAESNRSGMYSIINELGQTIQQFELNAANNYAVNIVALNPGIYFVVGANEHANVAQKVLVLK